MKLQHQFIAMARDLLLATLLVSGPALAQTTTFDWNTLGLSDSDAITSGAVVNSADGSTTVTLDWTTVISGGSFVPFDGLDYVSFETLNGGEFNVVDMGFDNSSADSNDRIIVTLTFSRAVTGLAFDLLDIDSGSWWDSVEVFADGANIRTVDSGSSTGSDYVSTIGPFVAQDTQPAVNGWQATGFTDAAANDTSGNMSLDFGGTAVTAIRIEFFSYDDGSPGDPTGQMMSIGNLTINQSLDLDSDDDGILDQIENPPSTVTMSLTGSIPDHYTVSSWNALLDGDTSFNASGTFRLHEDADDNIDLSLSGSVAAGNVVDVYWANDERDDLGIQVSLSNNGGASFFQSETSIPGTSQSITRQFSVTSSEAFNFIRVESIDTTADDSRVFEVGLNGSTGGPTYLVSGSTDTDGDGITDDLDLDSDNDGIPDLYESGTSAANIAADTNNDGTISASEAADADQDGLRDIFDVNTSNVTAAASIGTVPVNSDGDVVADFRDLDSDGDGIPDTIELRATTPYVQNDGNVSNDDADNDGVIAMFDANDGSTGLFGGTFTLPVNTDGEDEADYLDANSDGDAIDDIAESGLGLGGTDANGDGIDDSLNASYSDPDGIVNTPSTVLANEFGDTTEVAYREIGNVTVNVTKTAVPAQVNSGDTITFTITACETANTGDATNVVATDVLDAGYGAPSNPGGDVSFSYSNPTLTCNFGTVFSGTCETCTFDVTAP